MVERENLVQVGSLGKTFGNKGMLKASWEDPVWLEFIKDFSFVFLDIDGDLVPFRILRFEKDTIGISGIQSPEEANPLSGKHMFVPIDKVGKDLFDRLDQTNLLFQINDWTLVDVNQNLEIYPIAIEEYPQQVMAIFTRDGNTFYIPIHEESLAYIDTKGRKIGVNIDESLWDLYEK